MEGRAPLFMSITASYLAFYYYEKQLTFQKTVSLSTDKRAFWRCSTSLETNDFDKVGANGQPAKMRVKFTSPAFCKCTSFTASVALPVLILPFSSYMDGNLI